MEEKSDPLNNPIDSTLIRLPDSPSNIDPLQEPFLNFDSNSSMSFEDQSTIYRSLVTLVKAESPFDNAILDRAALFLKSLEPQLFDRKQATKLLTKLVLSSAGPPSGFVKSILTLLSSPHMIIVAAALSFLNNTFYSSSPMIQLQLVESDIVTNVLAIVQPHTLPILGNETILFNLNHLIRNTTNLALPSHLSELDITTAVEKSNHREMIFQKIVIPSSQFVTFLISNQNILNGDLFTSFMYLLSTLLRIGPYHRLTLEFVLASPIVMALPYCLSFNENDGHLWMTLLSIYSPDDWKKKSREVVQSNKRMIQALFSEGFESFIEQTLMRNKDVVHFWINSKTRHVYLVQIGCAPHSRHSTAIPALSELRKCSAPLKLSLSLYLRFLTNRLKKGNLIESPDYNRSLIEAPTSSLFCPLNVNRTPRPILVSTTAMSSSLPSPSYISNTPPLFSESASAFRNWDGIPPKSIRHTLTIYRSLVMMVKNGIVTHRSETEDYVILQIGQSASDRTMLTFVKSILILVSSPNRVVTLSTLEMLRILILHYSIQKCLLLVTTNLIPQLMPILRPLSFSLIDADDIHVSLIDILIGSIRPAMLIELTRLKLSKYHEQQPLRETVFNQALVPSEDYLRWL
ncbi:hypothetical protein BLNAU_18336 [Blattamonas nauphoetae]|uniref:Uncharacterized protein n=1 Tax=Blattamonas nauphoetae TaxID=2049346 RepID=A0ABQ9X4X9_9EUKA|nr:hypothetical protein BLNAU_18336 [Blattamonas nauphoetae]